MIKPHSVAFGNHLRHLSAGGKTGPNPSWGALVALADVTVHVCGLHGPPPPSFPTRLCMLSHSRNPVATAQQEWEPSRPCRLGDKFGGVVPRVGSAGDQEGASEWIRPEGRGEHGTKACEAVKVTPQCLQPGKLSSSRLS